MKYSQSLLKYHKLNVIRKKAISVKAYAVNLYPGNYETKSFGKIGFKRLRGLLEEKNEKIFLQGN